MYWTRTRVLLRCDLAFYPLFSSTSMVLTCCAVDCHNRAEKNGSVRFHRIPKDVERRRLWLGAIGRKDFQGTECTRLCGAHFITGNNNCCVIYFY